MIPVDTTDTVELMKLFMEPESIALVGLTRNTGPFGWNVLEHLQGYGYEGRIYPVNPGADEILGVKCYHSVADIPEVVDLAVIITPSHLGPKLVKECTEKGIRAITVVGQGYADGDDEGKRLQDEIVRIALEGGARIVGPNTFGTGNAFHKFNTAFTKIEMKDIPTGVICQTGLYISGLPDFHIVGKGIDIGNACDVDFADGLEYFEDDPQVEVIMLYIEGMRDGRRFMDAARRVSKKKPVLALKSGRCEDSSRAAQSHSGSLAGSDDVYDAAFKQSGVIRVTGENEFQDMTKAFLKLPLMKGRNVGIISITGGGAIMATDVCARHNLSLARLSDASKKRLDALAPPWQSFGNPADIWPSSMIAGNPLNIVLSTTVETFLQDENVDGLLIILPGEYHPLMDPVFSCFELIEDYDKPAILWCYSTDVDPVVELIEKRGRIVYYRTMDQAANVLSKLNDRYEYLNREDD
ncbi:MAG: CoA-binding protein [Chloroflexota bacterium]|nr:CoA-binding protein [Chloroflexota bacterium]